MQKKEKQEKLNHKANPLACSWSAWEAALVLLIAVVASSVPYLFSALFHSEVGLSMLTSVIQEACFFLLPLWIVYQRHGGKAGDLGFRKTRLFSVLETGIPWGLGLYFVNLLISMLIGFLFPQSLEKEQAVVTLLFHAGGWQEILLICVVVLLFAPVAEELLFRAFFLPALKKIFRPSIAVMLSAGIFALTHWNIWVFLPLFAGGVGFALLYEKYHNLFYNIVAHMTWNGVALLLFFIFGFK